MKNIFAKFQEYVKKPNRNVFDLQFRNNLTTKFGQLTPVFCKEVVPGDSFKIDTKFGLMLMPMKFPVQTPMKAYVHYFYVRNRTLWKDWMDFIGGTKDGLVLPYVQPIDKKKFFRVGGLADYLGVPNVLYSGDVVGFTPDSTNWNTHVFKTANYKYTTTYLVEDQLAGLVMHWRNTQGYQVKSSVIPYIDYGTNSEQPEIELASQVGGVAITSLYQSWNDYATSIATSSASPNKTILGAYLFANLPYYNERANKADLKIISCVRNGSIPLLEPQRFFLFFVDADGLVVGFDQQLCDVVETIPATNSNQRVSVFNYHITEDVYSSMHSAGAVSCYVGSFHSMHEAVTTQFDQQEDTGYSYAAVEYQQNYDLYSKYFPSVVYFAGNNVNVIGSDGEFSTTPYDSDIHLNALPFRAYEAIYNAYYRNPQNNPFELNGVKEYNRYNTTLEGGADTTQYDLFFRNWEYDFLTSAVQSPQQGVAPLVGMTMTGEATFADEEGNTYYAQAILNDQGEITGWQSHSSNMPVGSMRLLMDMAGTGISINDLRNVNAFQRFLENNIRHGLKYRDQIMSHFGVKVRYDELDMPEFLGGCSAEMEVYKVTQTSNSGDTPLGSFVGQAQVKKEFGHSITQYCDEHGFIIGIMSIVPVPVYSQLLPKFFVKNTQLDYFFPEFGHIGYQPILQKEVSPLQTFYGNGDLNKVFGYNRAWYDYLASTDEVHAQFRTTMRDFIMNRTFEFEPDLSEDFLLVDPEQLNDVFLAGTDDDDLYAPESDKIIGSLLFNVSAKRPIPMFGIPKLEA